MARKIDDALYCEECKHFNHEIWNGEDSARNLTGFSINGVFASLNTEYHDTQRL